MNFDSKSLTKSYHPELAVPDFQRQKHSSRLHLWVLDCTQIWFWMTHNELRDVRYNDVSDWLKLLVSRTRDKILDKCCLQLELLLWVLDNWYHTVSELTYGQLMNTYMYVQGYKHALSTVTIDLQSVLCYFNNRWSTTCICHDRSSVNYHTQAVLILK